MDKLNFYFFISGFTDKVCPILGYYSLNGVYTKIQSARDIQLTFGKVILKPNKGTKGQGIKIEEYPLPKTVKDSDGKTFKDYIVCPYLVQNNYSTFIFSNALNTIRVFTGILDGKAICISAVHRFGRTDVKDVDNFSKGGISVLINLDSGIMEKACYFTGKEKVSVKIHPDTNAPIVGVKIEGWNDMLSELLEIQQKISFIRYIAWDIAMINGSFLIIEANHVSDVDLYQCHGPLITDEEHKRFFEQFK